jgi:hypothetical protein
VLDKVVGSPCSFQSRQAFNHPSMGSYASI